MDSGNCREETTTVMRGLFGLNNVPGVCEPVSVRFTGTGTGPFTTSSST